MSTNGSKKIKTVLAALLLSVFFLIPPLLVYGQGTYNFASSSGLAASGNKAGYITSANAYSIEQIIAVIIYAVLGLVGVIFMGYALYGAVTWMTAQGNPEKVKKANNILNGALFGMMITLAAYVISYFLITYFWQ